MPSPGETLDGYELLRPIGEGGFGQVWLCRAPVTRDLRALKFIRAESSAALAKEYSALTRYKKAGAAPYLVPVEHADMTPQGLFYVMPLADGETDDPPESPAWTPMTLAAKLTRRRSEPAWFSSMEIAAMARPILLGLQAISEAGLVHRDIKPENILFFGGEARLADISLLTDDRTQVTRLGTPGYSTPSWFAGSHADLYGAAMILYTLLTGNDPDKMGRSAFLWPPQGRASLSSQEQREWLRLHSVVRRALAEKPTERYLDYGRMLEAVCATGSKREAWGASGKAKWAFALSLLGLVLWFVPILGVWVIFPGLWLGIRGLRSSHRGYALAAVWLTSIALVALAANAGIGAYQGMRGEMPILDSIVGPDPEALPSPGDIRAYTLTETRRIVREHLVRLDDLACRTDLTPELRLQAEAHEAMRASEHFRKIRDILYAYKKAPHAPWKIEGTPEEQERTLRWLDAMGKQLACASQWDLPDNRRFVAQIKKLIAPQPGAAEAK